MKLSQDEQKSYSSWRTFARGEQLDMISQAWARLSSTEQARYQYSSVRHRETFVAGLIERNDLDTIRACVESFGPRYTAQMPPQLQMAIDAALQGRGPEALQIARTVPS